MPCSEAQLAANRANSKKSSGPTTTSGKEASRRNGYKHGMTGEGVVIPEDDQAEISRLVEALTADMKPRTPAGLILIAQIATLSVREERCFQHESLVVATGSHDE